MEDVCLPPAEEERSDQSDGKDGLTSSEGRCSSESTVVD